jgi:hypothetical protein
VQWADIGNIFNPPGWRAWFRHEPGTWDQPEVRDARSEDRLYQGHKSICYFTFYRKHWGGFMQQVAVTPGNGMPLRRDVRYTCTCPDDGNWDNYACKHVVATMFALSDEFLLEPELLDLWRGRASDYEDRDDPRDTDDDEDEGEDDSTLSLRVGSGRTGRHLRLVRPGEGAGEGRVPAREAQRPMVDPLADLLRIPEGAALPDIGDIERIEPQLPRSRDLATVLRDALGNLRIEWD